MSTTEQVIRVDSDAWLRELAAWCDSGHSYFDFLTAIDDGPAGLRVVVRLTRPDGSGAVLLCTRLAGVVLVSATPLFAGADWHERETAEMFGIVFIGHPGLDPLLLPPDFVGHPLRKDFQLGARAVVGWPGGAESGGRRRTGAPGIPVGWGVPAGSGVPVGSGVPDD